MNEDIKKMFHDFNDFYRSPEHIINSINTAKNELSYSNYDNFNFDIAIKIIEKFCSDNNVPEDIEKNNQQNKREDL